MLHFTPQIFRDHCSPNIYILFQFIFPFPVVFIGDMLEMSNIWTNHVGAVAAAARTTTTNIEDKLQVPQKQ